MTFPQSIAQKVLLDCSRCCCICHKFCGFKIELHHIVQKAEGGADTYENCIPLCLDCHAEVKAYDPKHPKGRKYTEPELRQHRNKWYEKVKGEKIVVLHPDCIELDRKLFLKIREILPSRDRSISFIRSHIYANQFLFEAHNDLEQYRLETENPDFEFIDVDLEIRKSHLTRSIETFLEVLYQVTFTTEEWTVESKLMAVYPDIKYSKPDIYCEALRRIEEAAGKVCSDYDDLVRLGRRKLAVE